MAEYINFEAEVKFDSEKDDDNNEISSDFENSFIDDQETEMRQIFIAFKMLKMTLNRC